VLCNAQDRALKFLGIPVDGYKSEMIQKLRDKGYTYSKDGGEDVLTGEFNGTDVNIYIGTNNNKVWRIYIADDDTRDEYQIKLRFNTLCEQFERNSRYTALSEDQEIPMDEDISYEMNVNDKRYEAAFYQIPDDPNLMNDIEELSARFDSLNSGQQDSLAFEQQVEAITGLFAALSAYDAETFSKYDADYFVRLGSATEEEQIAMAMTLMEDIMSILSNRMVWFTISEYYGGYYISMYYDNGYNKASGEDL
jgi:hypothetical protein